MLIGDLENNDSYSGEAMDDLILTGVEVLHIADTNSMPERPESQENPIANPTQDSDMNVGYEDRKGKQVVDIQETSEGFEVIERLPVFEIHSGNAVISSMKRRYCDDHECTNYSCQSKRKIEHGEEGFIRFTEMIRLQECIDRIHSDPRGRIASTSTVSPPTVGLWQSPEQGWIKLNTFGFSLKSSGSVGTKMCIGDVAEMAVCGGVIRNFEGHVILSFVKQLGKVPNYTARCLGVHHGVLEIFSLPFRVRRLWIECDSPPLARLVYSDRKEGKAIHELLQSFEEWKVSCISDEGNRLARCTAIAGVSLGEEISVVDDVFPPLRWMVQSDIMSGRWSFRCRGT